VQIGTATDARQLAALSQQVTDGNRVGRFAAAVEFEDRLVHELMGRPVVVVRADHFHDVGDGVLGHQHPAEDALFRSQVVRRSTLELPAAGGEFGDTHGDPPPRLTDSGKSPRCRASHPF
jgi:hypothetical protein